jgi:glucokinase
VLVGFDVGGTKVLGVLVDPSSHVVVDREWASSAGSGPVLVATIAAVAERLRDRHDIEVGAIGLGIAGLASRSGVVRYSPNLPELVEFPVAQQLGDRLGVPVLVGNDATAAARAEARLGAGRGVGDFIFLGLGTGIGTGLVIDGHLVQGAHGFAGEAGHMVIDADGPEHHTGQRGPWEYFASGDALGRMGREAAAGGRFGGGQDAAGSVAAIDGTVVVQAMTAGDDEAVAIFDGFCREVARGVANLVLLLDPERLILGGGLADIGEPLRAGVERWIPELLLGASNRPPIEVRIAELGPDAGAIGAALLTEDRTG